MSCTISGQRLGSTILESLSKIKTLNYLARGSSQRAVQDLRHKIEAIDDRDHNYFKSLQEEEDTHRREVIRRHQSYDMFNGINIHKLLDQETEFEMAENIKRRKSSGDLLKFKDLWETLQVNFNLGPVSAEIIDSNEDLQSLIIEALKIPNDTSPESLACEKDPRVISIHGDCSPGRVTKEFLEFCKDNGTLRVDNIGLFTGPRGYCLIGPLAELERALINYTIDALQKRGFQIISVPDMLYPEVIEGCGMPTMGKRNLVYWLQHKLEDPTFCLAGTSEMSLGGYIRDKIFNEEELPLKLAAVSRCFRAEVSTVQDEKGIYRVHNFTKVEMFGVTRGTLEASEELQLKFREIQEELFSDLGLSYRVLEMPPFELGTPAYRKFDIEAWMRGKGMFGEISSCSNCTDFQSRRLNVQYESASDGTLKYVHTVNGTASAIPRMLISLIEEFQDSNAPGGVKLPETLTRHMTRPWSESIASMPKFDSSFLKARSQIDRCIKKVIKSSKSA